MEADLLEWQPEAYIHIHSLNPDRKFDTMLVTDFLRKRKPPSLSILSDEILDAASCRIGHLLTPYCLPWQR